MNKKKGIKPRTRFTRAYYKSLVKDNGFHEVIRKIRQKYPALIIDTNTPSRVYNNNPIEFEKDIILTIYTKDLSKQMKVITWWSLCDRVWYFSKDGDMIDIYQTLSSFEGN